MNCLQRRRAILVTYSDKNVLDEALGLVEAARFEVLGVVTQDYLSKAKYGVGSGKAEEVGRLVKDKGVDAVVFDERLQSSQIYNLTKLTHVEVFDREKLILEIFNRRVSSAEAKLQVRMAELRYEIPRAKEKVRMSKTGEQPGFFGLGRYDVDDYHRSLVRRITVLNKKLRRSAGGGSFTGKGD